ncbi:MAG: DUF885 family protein [Fimbriimonas sp.]
MALPALLLLTSSAPAVDTVALLSRYASDESLLERKYPIQGAPARTERFRRLYQETLKGLDTIDFNALDRDAKIDVVLLDGRVRYELRKLDVEASYDKPMAPLIPFADDLRKFEEARQRNEPVVPAKAAEALNELAKTIGRAKNDLAAQLDKKKLVVTNGVDPAPAGTDLAVSRSTANRALRTLNRLKGHLGTWHRFYNGYDPMFTWWTETPMKAVNAALDDYIKFVRERLVGISEDDKTTIIGFPIGRDALMADLEAERIPYTPEELLQIAEREYAWCEAEMKKASRALGHGDDWHKALEQVKGTHVEPGDQPKLILDLAKEAEKFLDDRQLVTIPDLCREGWRMEMMSPERQLQSPFFLGGESIIVSFPTNTMAHEAKLMSLRGNNRAFARATVHHELIPGHWLQQFMTERYKPHREAFGTPFWWEGNALYWEMVLWDLGFGKTPEEKIGMLFWRMHRCVRITFSLGFHLGKLTPQQCVDMLVDRVGHERENALAEVRRSLAGDYSPLYQCAYMLGGLQFRGLKRELVDSGKMKIRDFHDAILRQGPMPVDLVRAALTNVPLERVKPSTWRF